MISSRILCVAAAVVMGASSARAQVAPVPYWSAPFGLSGGTTIASTDNERVTFYGTTDDDGFRKGFSFRSFSYPVSSFASGFSWGGIGAFSSSGLAADGAQYGYSFKGIGDTPVTLFGGVSTLNATPNAFTALTTSGFNSGRTLATSVNAGIAFKPTSNVSLSFSAGYVQPSEVASGDLSSRLLSGEQPVYFGGRR